MGFPPFVLKHIPFVLLAALNIIAIAQEGQIGDPAEIGETGALYAILRIFKDPTLTSNWTGEPCDNGDQARWIGIQCSNGHVSGIVLEGRGLVGELIFGDLAFALLQHLSVISFKNNALRGNMMDLIHNPLMHYIDLSGNELDGSISSSFLGLNLLDTLLLQDNRLIGNIPAFQQPSLKTFNVSNNDLEGSIPKTPSLQSFGPDSYSGNPRLCGPPSHNPCTVNSSPAPFKWRSRLSVARGVAQALDYLHQNTNTNIVPHGNLKSSNVLLDKDDEPLVSDYGLASLITPPIATQRMVVFKSPEYEHAKTVTKQSDVWSYGLLLIELLTNRVSACSAPLGFQGLDLSKWVRRTVREEWTAEIFDAEIAGERKDVPGILRVLKIAIRCIDRLPENRPEMREVLRELEKVEATLPAKDEQNEQSGDRYSTSYGSFSTSSSGIIGEDKWIK